jgi:predicted ATP-dependent endonuclease of OLD family
MELQLKNIGMIKEANVKLDGLTVIAGENDTGKSTVGKALFMFLNSFQYIHQLIHDLLNLEENKEQKSLLEKSLEKYSYEKRNLPKLIFQSNIRNAKFLLKYDKYQVSFYVNEYNQIDINQEESVLDKKTKVIDSLIIETPLVWNFTDFFRDIAQVESQMNIKLDYPYLMKDLNFKLHIKNDFTGINIRKRVIALMGGEFKKDEMGRYYFDKKGQRIELVNTATGIKYFGIFQILSQNNYLTDRMILILDEPEVHLHPKWQLEMAKIIVELVEKGVKIIVNSHSPYMIDALKYYSDELKVKTNFYLAEKNKNEISTISDVTMDISPIFEKLTEPLRDLRKMKLGLE